MGHRDRSQLELTVLHVEIETECYAYAKAIARRKGQPLSTYVSDIIKARMERTRKKATAFIQNDEKSLQEE